MDIVSTIILAIFTDVFVYAIVVPVVPYVFVERMGVAEDSIQQQVSQALAGLIVGSLGFETIANRIKQRQILMIGGLMVILGAPILLCMAKVI